METINYHRLQTRSSRGRFFYEPKRMHDEGDDSSFRISLVLFAFLKNIFGPLWAGLLVKESNVPHQSDKYLQGTGRECCLDNTS